MNRRSFFRQVLLRGIDRAQEAARAVGNRVVEAMDLDERGAAAPAHPAPPRQPARFLRPPGALPEPAFLDACTACGACVEACPAQCIELAAHVASGGPYIVPRESPCVVCDDLSCMKVCPTGALRLVESPADIRMGVAVVDHDRCLRSPSRARAAPAASVPRAAAAAGEDCRLCIAPCPFGESAIGLDAAGRIEIRPGCVGCGVCERACPTEPSSVWVEGGFVSGV